jgi:aminopeptidase N
MALCELREASCVQRTLVLCASGKVPTQDIALMLARMLDNPFAREATWRYVKANWRTLERRMPAMLAGRLVEATPALQTEAKRREVMAFFARHPVPSAERALKQANERFRLDAALRKRAAPALRGWLAAL